jgi:hypothetical protein
MCGLTFEELVMAAISADGSRIATGSARIIALSLHDATALTRQQRCPR